MNLAVIKIREHVRSEKLESIPAASMLTAGLSVSSAVVLYEYKHKKKSEFRIVQGECKTIVSVLI